VLRINYERFDCLFRNKASDVSESSSNAQCIDNLFSRFSQLIELAVADRYNKAAGFIVKGLMGLIPAEEDNLLLETSCKPLAVV
jgi:hypothetical protein